ncbi:MAG TPA: hypothetical protein VFC79_00925 [Tissierellaceae bacterium]|nr:hypothetical protein [Tissierellaceae bacterium]
MDILAEIKTSNYTYFIDDRLKVHAISKSRDYADAYFGDLKHFLAKKIGYAKDMILNEKYKNRIDEMIRCYANKKETELYSKIRWNKY